MDLVPIAVFHSDDDFSLGVSFFKIPKRVRNLTQRVTSIYHRFHFAGFDKLCQENQILLVWFHCWHGADLLTSSLRPSGPKDHVFEQQPQVGEASNNTYTLGGLVRAGSQQWNDFRRHSKSGHIAARYW